MKTTYCEKCNKSLRNCDFLKHNCTMVTNRKDGRDGLMRRS
jgi:hypothetical protein